MKKHSSKSLKLIPAALCLSFVLLAINATAQVTNYWDTNGNTPGAGGPTPNGDWDDMSAGGFWTTDPTGMSATGPWSEGNTPMFSALNGVGATTTDATGSYTITVGTGHTIAGMQTAPGSGPVTVSGAGPLQIASGMQQFISTNLTINAPLTDPTIGAPGGLQTAAGNNLSLFGNNTFSGGLNLNGGSTYINSASSVGAASGTISPILGGASPVFSALYSTVNTVTLNNPLSIATANAGIVFVPATTTPLTLSGNINLSQDFYCRNNGPGTAANPLSAVTGILTLSGNISGTGGMILSCNGDNNSTIALYGANTYTGRTISDPNGQTRIFINFNTAATIASGTPNSLGTPPDAATGQINLGHPFNATTGFADALRYTGSSDSTTDRIINNANTGTAVGGMWLFAEGTGAITYSGNITASSGSTASRTLILQGSSTALNTISGSIQDSSGGTANSINVTKESPSTWRLLGNNTFSGFLTVQNTTGLGGNSTLYVGGNNVYSGNTTISGNSTLILAGANPLPHGPSFHGNFTIANTGKFELAGFNCFINGGGDSAGSIIDNNTGTATLTVDNNTVNTGPNFYGQIKETAPGVLNFAANCGGTCFLAPTNTVGTSGANFNTYSGYSACSNAVLQFTNETALGVIPASLCATNIIIDSNLGWNGTANANNYYFRAQNGGPTTVSLNANRGIFLGNANGYGGGIGAQSTLTALNVNGPISGPGGLWIGGGTPHAATGPVVLFNTSPGSTYAGGTYIVGGTLKLGASNVLPTGTPLTMSDANATTFDMANNSQTIGPLASANTGTPTVKASGALTIKQTGNTTFNGVVSQSGTLTLDATSTGTLTLAGTSANTFNGAVNVNGGTLELAKASALAGTSLTVATAANLKLSNASSLPTTATHNLAATPNAATEKLNFTGTQTITALNFGATSMAKGTWGAVGSGALHQSNVFDPAGSGLLNVTSSTITPAATTVASPSGTTLSYNLGAGNWFVLLGTNNVAAPLSLWTRLATNGSTPGSFTIPAVGSQPQMFYRVKSE